MPAADGVDSRRIRRRHLPEGGSAAHADKRDDEENGRQGEE
jgi:hypothetical protein